MQEERGQQTSDLSLQLGDCAKSPFACKAFPRRKLTQLGENLQKEDVQLFCLQEVSTQASNLPQVSF